MIEHSDNPWGGIGEQDRIRKPTRWTAAQIGIMAAAVAIVCLSVAVGIGVWVAYGNQWRAAAVVGAGFVTASGVYRTHWRSRQRD